MATVRIALSLANTIGLGLVTGDAGAQKRSWIVRWPNLSLVVRSSAATGVEFDFADEFADSETPDAPTTSPVLTSRGANLLALARDTAPPPGEPPYLLFFADSAGANRLVARTSANNLRELLKRLQAAAAEAGWNPDSATSGDETSCAAIGYEETDCTPVLLPPGAELQAPSISLTGPGMVWTQYVVDERGRADPASIDIIYSDHPALNAAVRSSLARIRFTPATRRGQPVRQQVEQTFRFDPAAVRP